jgi:hypothetical protein
MEIPEQQIEAQKLCLSFCLSLSLFLSLLMSLSVSLSSSQQQKTFLSSPYLQNETNKKIIRKNQMFTVFL